MQCSPRGYLLGVFGTKDSVVNFYDLRKIN